MNLKPVAVQQTSDGGFAVLSVSYARDFYQNPSVMKLDADGNIVWQKVYGVNMVITSRSFQQTSDGGYVLGGTIFTGTGIDLEGWVVKLDSGGSIVWQKSYNGGPSPVSIRLDTLIHSVRQTLDGGYIVAGSWGGDNWVMKLDPSGNMIWQKTYANCGFNMVALTSDGGYAFAGTNNGGSCVLRIDSAGNVVWRKIYLPSNGYFIIISQASDGGFVLGGEISMRQTIDTDEAWIMKLDSAGNTLWQKAFGEGSNYIDYLASLSPTSDGGYVAAGYGYCSNSGFCTGSANRAWLFKIDGGGNMVWHRLYGGPQEDDVFLSVQQTSDSGYIVAGRTFTSSSFVWLLRFDNQAKCCIASLESTFTVTTTSVSVISQNTTAYQSFIVAVDTDVSDTDTHVTMTRLCGGP
jgi:hypothetical protein